ncbi:MAG: valine--tRNA ligase [Eubacteriaceae bacterium]|nr:valine--tRNA ligase [Eubacteriaceae bacterium]
MKELDKIYDPSSIEEKIYRMWEEKGCFAPEINPKGKPYTIVLPPPNITGQLHIGHAFNGTLQDILIRYKRMQGYAALWVPGEDHASIATEVKVLDKIRKEEGKTKADLDRDEFMEKAWDWANFYRAKIVQQLKALGVSCDWSRERFTLDEGCNEAVKEAFIRLYDKGLIYRANKIINWCPDCKTALSDAEVEYEEEEGHLWHLRYPIEGTDRCVVVATTRPETMLGDTGVAVNPNDERYTDLVGKYCILPLVNRRIPIIADEYVDMEFGTGCVKMTPCHDPNDFEVGLRHNLEQIRILNDDATMADNCGKYAGMDRYEARDVIVKDLEELGLLEKIEKHVHNVGKCYRCHTTVEPITSNQWFVEMKPLAEPALEAVYSGDTKFVPDRFKKIYFNWMENVRDWCISRQLWWGHRIPAYYCDKCGEIVVAKDEPHTCPKCGGTSFTQEKDVLDTWFSSALWPFSTLGWPNETEDFKKFYPNDVLVTGFDIIFFWVARMIFSGLEYCGKTPFHHVYINGIIRDDQGRKMSKSLGNGVDPLEEVEKYGADAVRFTLVTGNAAGNDARWQYEKVEASRNFANKVNNAARFIMMNLADYDTSTTFDQVSLTNIDKWIISRTNEMVRDVTDNLDKYELGIALEKLYNFIWSEFCDWYIEFSKSRLTGEDKKARLTAQYTLYTSFCDILKLLHPFMPFITEEIYDHLTESETPLIITKWPEYDASRDFPAETRQVAEIIDAIRGIRNARAKMNIPPSKKAPLYIITESENESIYRGNEDSFIKMASCESVEIRTEEMEMDNALTVVTNTAKCIIPMDSLIDREKEIARLTKEKDRLTSEIARLEAKLSNEGFTSKAPEKVVAAEREKLENYRSLLSDIEAGLSSYMK